MLVQSRARLRFVSIPPRKMRLIADAVKGMPVEKALNILSFSPRIAAHHVAKTIKSAAANALSVEGTDNLKPEDLVIKSIFVDNAPTAKRIRFQSMGRVFRIRKRHCHLTVMVEGEMVAEAPKRKKSAKKAEAQDTDEQTKTTTTKTDGAKSTAKKSGTRKSGTKKTATNKSAPKTSTTKKTTARKSAVRKTTARKSG
jgi:large subunit ribosomal protein L22